MTSDLAVRKAVVERIQPVSVDDCFPFKFEPSPAPAVFVLADYPLADPEQGFSSKSARWQLCIMRVLDMFDEQEAQEELSRWADPDGPLVRALLDFDEEITDSLSRLTRDVRVPSFGTPNNMMTDDGVTQYYQKIRVAIRA